MLEAVAWLLADGGRPHGRKGTVMAGADGGDAGAAVAVIGAGIMGSAMTRNLFAAGLTTRVWDQSASATGPLADAGAVVAASAPHAVQGAAVVITMLPTADVVDSGARCPGLQAARPCPPLSHWPTGLSDRAGHWP